MIGAMPLVAQPASGRVFRGRRRVRLSDVDARNRLRLDAIARYLQDVATDDVDHAGWSAGDGGWVVRRTRYEIVAPVAGDETVELATWCAGIGASAALRRTSIAGSGGGRVETETVWIHLDANGRPARVDERFHALYAESASGGRASTRLELREPPVAADRRPWPLRVTDVDLMGHVNNAAYWSAVEQVLPRDRTVSSAVLEYRDPLDLGDPVELATWRDGSACSAAFVVGRAVRASARVVLG
jgi:acyl-ACP thioesterase